VNWAGRKPRAPWLTFIAHSSIEVAAAVAAPEEARARCLSQAQDEIAIVTVGASGIGAACLQTPARDGAEAIVTDFDDAGGHVLMDKVKLRGGEAMFLPIDLHEVAKLGVPLGSAVQARGIANGVPIPRRRRSSDITGTDVHL
jgi:hypothetical protein